MVVVVVGGGCCWWWLCIWLSTCCLCVCLFVGGHSSAFARGLCDTGHGVVLRTLMVVVMVVVLVVLALLLSSLLLFFLLVLVLVLVVVVLVGSDFCMSGLISCWILF